MREIKAIIRQERLDNVLESLHEVPGLPGITISSVRGVGRRRSPNQGVAVEFGETNMVKLEVAAPVTMAEAIIETIRRAALTGRAGDGKIFVSTVDDVVRIRTAERGKIAL